MYDEPVTIPETKYQRKEKCDSAAQCVSAVRLSHTSDLMKLAWFSLADSWANCWGH